MFANDSDNYGWFSIVLHWLMAILIVGMFVLGIVMVDLDYYDSWYQRAPHIHESIGLILAALLLLRLLARVLNPPPPPLPTLPALERKLAISVHWLFYGLMLTVIASGYLISSAGARDIPLFDWFEVPALPRQLEHQEDIAGRWHLTIAWGLIALSVAHTMAALKHHFFDRNRTLRRILGL